MVYAGLFNSSYKPNEAELVFINDPVGQLGPYILGQFGVTFLQAIMLVQYWNYLVHFRRDRRWIVLFVHIAFLLCIFKFVYVLRQNWDKFGPHYGDWFYLIKFNPVTIPIVISSTLVNAVCQVFYIYRCWMLSHNSFFLVLSILSFISTLGTGIAMISAVVLATGGDTAAFKLIFMFSNATLASGLACDMFITTFTCYYLLRAKAGTPRTDNVVFRLVKVSVESAMGPTIFALANLVFNTYFGTNAWYNLPSLTLSHVYACSLLYTVNARRDINKYLDATPYPPDFLSTRQMVRIAVGVAEGGRGQETEDNSNATHGCPIQRDILRVDESFAVMPSTCSMYSESASDGE